VASPARAVAASSSAPPSVGAAASGAVAVATDPRPRGPEKYDFEFTYRRPCCSLQ